MTDDAGGRGVGTTGFLAAAAPGVAIAGAPPAGLEGTPVTLAARPTGSGLSGPFTYAWTVTRASTPFGTPQNGTSNLYTFTPDAAGSYAVGVTITDARGQAVASPPTLVTVVQAAPRPTITGVPAAAATYTPFTLQGGVDGSTGPVTLSWSVFNTGLGRVRSTGTGPPFTESPPAAGSDVVTLTATRADGTSGTAEVVVPVTPSASTLTVTTPAAVQEGGPAQFSAQFGVPDLGTSDVFAWTVNLNTNGSVSLTTIYPDPDNDALLTYQWRASVGGSVFASQSSISPDFSFKPTTGGDYQVSLTVV